MLRRAFLLVLLCGGAAAAEMPAACGQSDDPAEGLAACTGWIESGALDGADLSDALSNRGYWNYALDRLDDAEADLARAIELSPDNAEAYYHLGLVRDRRGDHAGAVAEYDRALALVPGWAVVLVDRGNAWHRAGEYRRAIEDYAEALGRGADDAIVYSNIGVSFTEMGAFDRALAAHNRALELDPGDDGSVVNRAETLERLGRYDDAVAGYERALEMDFPFWAPRMKLQMAEAGFWDGPPDASDSAAFRAALRACVESPDC